MKRLALILLLATGGCTVITYDRVFPKLDWYWSKEAKAQRKDREELKQMRQAQTNSVTVTNR